MTSNCMGWKSLFQEALRARLSQWAEGIAAPFSGPWLCYLSVTNICNSRCRVCAREKAMRPERGSMDEAIFERILGLLPDSIKKIYLMKQGEPFLNSRLPLFARRIRQEKPDVHISVHTNGIASTRKRLKAVLPNINSLGVSISAINAETFQKVHGVDKFDIVMRNLQSLSELLITIPPDERPHVFIDYVKQQANSHEDEECVVDFFRKRFPGISSVDFHWVFNFQGEIEEGNREIYERLPEKIFPRCVFPWSALTFCYDGQVSYCFVEPRENTFLADIQTEETFQDIWNSPAYQAFRTNMAKRDFAGLQRKGIHCSHCTWLWSMRSQSPRNLTFGYTPDHKARPDVPDISNILENSPEAAFASGLRLYLDGDLFSAEGLFRYAAGVTPDEEMKSAANRMSELVTTCFERYKHISVWKSALTGEMTNPDSMECKYYTLNNNS